MINERKPSATTLSEIKKIEEELSIDSINGHIGQLRFEYANMVEDLRSLASRVSEQGKAIITVAQMLSSKSSTISHLIGGTLSFVESGTFKTDAEYLTDDAKFIVFCEKAANHTNKLKALNTIRVAIDTMNGIIDNHRLKLAKMQSYEGRTEAEIEVIKRKAYANEKALGHLLKRGETLTNLFYAVKRSVEKTIVEASRDIRPIFCKK